MQLRPLDDSGDVDTGLKVPTDKHGNGYATDDKNSIFASDSVDSGTLVVKQLNNSSLDQFLAAFKVR